MHYILFILFRWVVGIWLVMKLTSDDLLDRLKKKGTREPAFTKALIIKKLNDDDDDVATTSLKVRIILCTDQFFDCVNLLLRSVGLHCCSCCSS